jgi:type III pantothenate kinase
MNAQHLLIDAGNTRLKWVLVVDGQWQLPGATDYSDLSALSLVLSAGFKCTIASVARIEHENQVRALLARFDIEPRWLKADAQFRDIKNTYANPTLLGVDRWMGLIAARQRSQTATLVVSLGTAMTVDALSTEGVFLGGLIAPGQGMMQQALQQGTARVGEVTGTWQPFPQSTPAAVRSGIVAALSGAIRLQYARLAEQCGCQPHCLMTGGDAAMVLSHLDFAAEHVPYLVLEGIDCVVREDLAG